VKDEFVSNVSPELRTPITNLKLRHHLLAARPDRWEGHLAVMSRETQRLEQIIESLLYLSRLDQERVDWNPTQVDLNQLGAQFVRDRVALAQSGELSLSFTGAPDLPLVEADVALWELALSILLTNAFNYTPVGGHVEVRTQMREREGQRWVGVSVSDTGPGISPDEQSHLFERFFRGTAGRESGTPGTGLGLSIVQEIVNNHRGQVEVFSEGVPGQGATFSLWLLAVGSADEKRQAPEEEST
jgi:two-component system sensor histidine kinase SenX3